MARQLHLEVAPLFFDVDAKLAVCHLTESPERSATYYSDGACEGNYWFEFSAARQTTSPHLSKAENKRLFGSGAAIHGHNYRARLTFRTESGRRQAPLFVTTVSIHCVKSLHAELDHRFLNKEVAAMKDRPVTTESLAGYIYERVNALLPLHRVRLHEQDDFFAEIWDDESVFLGMQMPFHAAHRLHAVALSRPRTRSSMANAITHAVTAIVILPRQRSVESTMNEVEHSTISWPSETH